MDKKEDNGYEAIGKFVVEFSKLTYTLGLCIQKLVEKDIELLKIINNDERIKKIAKKGFIVDREKVKELGDDLIHILTGGEIYKILKLLLYTKYSHDLEFLIVLDVLFPKIAQFCDLDGYRNDLIHGGLLIDPKEPGRIMIHRRILVKGSLVDKSVNVNLDDLNIELSLIGTYIYALARILHQGGKIEDHLILQNGKPIFRDTIKPFIAKKGKI